MANYFMEELVIIGGGVAGLGCLNALLNKNISPLLLEASSIGSPKMCGEFLAPAVIERLKTWGIGPIQPIKQAQFFGINNALRFSFPREAGAYSRHDAELALATRATQQGGRIREQSPLKEIIPATNHTPFILNLNSGESIQAHDVIFATGRFSKPMSTSAYVGFKTHLSQIVQPETLLMFSLTGGYLGIVPVTSETSNLTCLIKKEVVARKGSCRAFLDSIFSSLLESDNLNGTLTPLNWLEGAVPSFGVKTTPNWPHAYWIGDAVASIHPAIGYGFAHSLSSALLAADYYLKRDPIGYHQAVKRIIRPKRMIGQCMHSLLQKPQLCNTIASMLRANTWLAHRLLKTLDY